MSIEVVSHALEVSRATEKAMKQAATMIGGTVEGHAKELCPVDTGLLRNSITYALGGESPQISQYTSDADPTGKREVTYGEYSGSAPQDEDHQVTVYIGTNVEYAPYQELGAPNIHLDARPFLRPAMEDFQREIEQIIEMCFKDLN